MVQVEPVVVDLARAVDRPGQKLFDPGGPGEAQNGAAAETEFPDDGSQAVAAFDAFVDLLVALPRAGDKGTRPAVDVQLGQGGVPEGVPVVLGFPDGEGFAQSARCRPTMRSTASARLCSRCQASATCRA
ncbi:hypothetical protein [Streptomyces chrestomyceticus]|uniref:hypothetical protein n=1 Tax=Streptomyces chrestomyceticus TaxID=68185 RepID=UPI001FD0AC29|nr:hypothetical protein [Streptomyces chrestomyceticus]